MRKLVTSVICLVFLAVLAGCSEDEGTKTLDLDDSPSASVDGPTGSTSGSAATDLPSEAPAKFDAKGHEVVPGELSVKGDPESSVAAAWLDYWRVRLEAFHAAELDPSALGEVATGEAADQVISYVGFLEEKSLHTTGDLLMDVDRVKVNGTQAKLRSCTKNKSVDRTEDGEAAEPLNPFYVFSGQLRLEGGQWRVADVGIASRSAS